MALKTPCKVHTSLQLVRHGPSDETDSDFRLECVACHREWAVIQAGLGQSLRLSHTKIQYDK